MTRKRKALFLCARNSSRSIMAEALVNHYLGETWEAYSAGIDPTSVNPYTIKALRELGIEIPNAHSKRIDVFRGQQFDKVFTLCDEAREACPLWLGSSNVQHITFPDPSLAQGNDQEKIAIFREIRDQIKDIIIPKLLK